MEPNADVVKGFGPVSKMNSFQGKLTDADVVQVVAYLKYLKDPSLVSKTPEGELEKEDAENPAESEAGKL